MKPTFASNPPQPSPPGPWGQSAPEEDGNIAEPGQSALYFGVPTLYAPPTDSADEAETRVILEMRYREYAARRALEELFERGEPELLPS
jgi:hypothetical protein